MRSVYTNHQSYPISNSMRLNSSTLSIIHMPIKTLSRLLFMEEKKLVQSLQYTQSSERSRWWKRSIDDTGETVWYMHRRGSEGTRPQLCKVRDPKDVIVISTWYLSCPTSWPHHSSHRWSIPSSIRDQIYNAEDQSVAGEINKSLEVEPATISPLAILYIHHI